MTAIFTADEILKITGGKLFDGITGNRPGRLIWDVDSIQKDDWFVARASGVLDTHDLLATALERGAQGCLVNRRARYGFAPCGATLLTVSDTKIALLELTKYWVKKATKKTLTVTGTTGRKDTINLIEFLLRRDYRIHTAVERGEMGTIPDLLAMPEGVELLLAEVSGTERGEVARKGSFLAPDLAVITTSHHPIPSAQRNARVAALNLEILETIDDFGEGTAIIYDDNVAVQERADLLLSNLKAIRYSQDTQKFTNSGLTRLVQRSGISQTETKVEVSAWCALTAAVCLGFSLKENPHIVSEVIVNQD